MDVLAACFRAPSFLARYLPADDTAVQGALELGEGRRVVPLVRLVHGDTKPETRERLALAFNSPLFPEILVSSSVMGEGDFPDTVAFRWLRRTQESSG